jgi:DNA-binding transcriptional LysR family regulator
MHSLDWNDLRYVAAIVSVGSAAAAARRLGVSHATVLRRVQALENDIGTPLFYRLPTGYEPTEAGGKLAEMGATIESAITDTRRTIDGQTKDLAGSIRFSTTDSFACVLMPPVLKTFRERYPAIEVEMIATNSRLDLDRREADVVLRPTVQPPESWVGAQLGRLDVGLYAAASYLEKQKSQDWRTFDWVAPGGPLALRSTTAWLTSQVDSDRWVITVDSFVAMRELVLQDIGAAILPQFMGHDKRLQLLQALPHDMSRSLWLLTHKNLRRTGRIKAFMQHVSEAIRVTLRDSDPAKKS